MNSKSPLDVNKFFELGKEINKTFQETEKTEQKRIELQIAKTNADDNKDKREHEINKLNREIFLHVSDLQVTLRQREMESINVQLSLFMSKWRTVFEKYDIASREGREKDKSLYLEQLEIAQQELDEIRKNSNNYNLNEKAKSELIEISENAEKLLSYLKD